MRRWELNTERTDKLAPGGMRSYLAMGLLYKKTNWLWPWVIRHRLTHTLWHPLVEASRLRHLHYRKELIRSRAMPGGVVVAPGV